MALKLKRVKDIDQRLQERLQSAGIQTAADLFRKNDIELISMLDATSDEVGAVFESVARYVVSAPKTALEMLQQHKDIGIVFDPSYPTLRAGAGITELVGGAGVGKTQACLHLAAAVTLSAASSAAPASAAAAAGAPSAMPGVVYVDTEGTFSSARLIEIARSRFSQFHTNTAAIAELVRAVWVFKEQTSEKLLDRLKSLEAHIIDKGVKLLIVDSVANVIRPEFDKEHLPQRHERLAAIASQLKYISEKLALPVVVTNQLTTKSGAADAKHESSLQAALGVGWAHAVTTRLVLEDFVTHKRIRIGKSPMFAAGAWPYQITSSGLEILRDDEAATVAGDGDADDDGASMVTAATAATAIASASAKQFAALDGDVTRMSIVKQHKCT